MYKGKSKISDSKSALTNKRASNPLSAANDIISQINAINSNGRANKLIAAYNNSYKQTKSTVDYKDLLHKFAEMVSYNDTPENFYSTLHNLCISTIGASFTGIGIYHDKSQCIHVKITNKENSTYSSRIFKQNEDSDIIKTFINNEVTFVDSSEFLNIPYLPKTPVVILPLSFKDEKYGVLILGDEQIENNLDIYKCISSVLSLYVVNTRLTDLKNLSSSTDTLTGLSSHGAFQEKLSNEIKKAETLKNNLAVIIFDINNISQINRELGHAKGDEIIRTVADKIVQSSSDKSLIGRYGGDEIATIMQNTTIEEAKYFAEYVAYSLSCCLIDDVGPIRVSIGIASYPKTTQDQEKLLIMAEQAMYISKSKGYQNGMASIISSQDYDFWDDMALDSFASVLTKRHAQIGVNFEEELVKKFHNEEIISQNHLIDVVTSLASAIDAKDTYTKGHSTGVAKYSEALARAIGLGEKDVERIKLGAMLHDVGKIGIPENVLRKPTGLSDEEWNIMKQHPTIGAEKVIKPNPNLHDLIPIVKYHHERYDGKGYPEGLKGEDIPLNARIVAVADAYHAMVSDRPYRKGMSISKACSILNSGAGEQWDKELVRAFVEIAPTLSVI